MTEEPMPTGPGPATAEQNEPTSALEGTLDGGAPGPATTLASAMEEAEPLPEPLTEGPDLASLLADPSLRERLATALGRPAEAAGYKIEARHPLVAPDSAVNERLHAAGLTQDQAQLVYDLAAEVLVPAIEDVMAEAEASRMVDELVHSFGGREVWDRTASQLRDWGRANLDPATYATLSTSPQGVRALHTLMRSQEPLLADGGGRAPALDAAALDSMVADPRYWRDRDPSFVARVTDGFAKLFAR